MKVKIIKKVESDIAKLIKKIVKAKNYDQVSLAKEKIHSLLDIIERTK